MVAQVEIDEIIDQVGSLVGNLEDAMICQQRHIAKLEALIELLCGRRWEDITFRQAKDLGERIQNELLNN